MCVATTRPLLLLLCHRHRHHRHRHHHHHHPLHHHHYHHQQITSHQPIGCPISLVCVNPSRKKRYTEPSTVFATRQLKPPASPSLHCDVRCYGLRRPFYGRYHVPTPTMHPHTPTHYHTRHSIVFNRQTQFHYLPTPPEVRRHCFR